MIDGPSGEVYVKERLCFKLGTRSETGQWETPTSKEGTRVRRSRTWSKKKEEEEEKEWEQCVGVRGKSHYWWMTSPIRKARGSVPGTLLHWASAFVGNDNGQRA